MNLARSAAVISGLTLLSRITGLVRETLIAATFGAGPLTDAFFVAFRLPNMLRRMFAEGAFAAAFVPMLAEEKARADEAGDPARAGELINRVATALFWVVLLISITGVLGAGALVWLIAGGLAGEPGSFDAAVTMTRWMFPYILLISMISLSAGILNTWQRFAIPAFTPVLLNLAIIGASVLLTPYFDPPIYALAVGVMLGGVAQLLIQIPALMRIGMLPRIGLGVRQAFADPRTRQIMTLMAPLLLASSAHQISLLINTHIASRLPTGSVSWVNFGDRLMEFPNALIGVALSTVLLASLSAAVANRDTSEYSALLDWGMRLAFVLALPAGVALAAMAEPLTALIFHYGRFDDHDLAMTALTVRAYGVGLVGFAMVKILTPGFFAHQNVATPVKIALISLVITQLLNLLFVPWFAHAGLALSISLAAWVNAGLLLAGLLRAGAYQKHEGWPLFLLRALVAATIMGLALAWFSAQYDWAQLQQTPWQRIGLVLAMVAGGAALYGAVLVCLGLRPATLIRKPATS